MGAASRLPTNASGGIGSKEDGGGEAGVQVQTYQVPATAALSGLWGPRLCA